MASPTAKVSKEALTFVIQILLLKKIRALFSFTETAAKKVSCAMVVKPGVLSEHVAAFPIRMKMKGDRTQHRLTSSTH